MRVMWLTGSGVARMGEEQFQNEKMYHATMNIAKALMGQGAMTAEEYRQIDTIFTRKYQPVFGTLLVGNDLLLSADRGNMDTERS